MKIYIVSVVVSLVLVATLSACSTYHQPDKAEPTRTLVPVLIKEWSGVADKTTEPFTINGNVWAISYLFTPEPVVGIYANLLMVDVKKPNNSFYLSSPIGIANTKQPISDCTYIYDRGTFFLEITCMSGSWSIQVFDFK